MLVKVWCKFVKFVMKYLIVMIIVVIIFIVICLLLLCIVNLQFFGVEVLFEKSDIRIVYEKYEEVFNEIVKIYVDVMLVVEMKKDMKEKESL